MNDAASTRRRSPPVAAWAALATIVVAHVLINVWYTAHMGSRMDGDETDHLQRILFARFHHWDFIWHGQYTPFFYFVSLAFHALFGVGIQVSVAANIPFIAALVVGTWGAARRTTNSESAAVLAAALASMLPLASSLSRMVMLDYAGAGMIALALWALMETRGFSQAGPASWFGIAAGLGLLTRDHFAVYMAGPVLVELTKSLRRGGVQRTRALLLVITSAMVAFFLAMVWYANGFLQKIAMGATRATWGANHADVPFWSWRNFMFYPFTVSDVVLGPWLFAPFLIAAVAYFARKSEQRLFWTAFFLVPWIAFSTLHWKLARYVTPWSCGFAVIFVAALWSIPRAPWRRAAAFVVTAIAAVVFAVSTFGFLTLESVQQNGWWAPVLGVDWERPDYQEDIWTGPPRRETTRIEELGAAIARASQGLGRDPVVVMLLNGPTPGEPEINHPFGLPILIPLVRAGLAPEIKVLRFDESGEPVAYERRTTPLDAVEAIRGADAVVSLQRGDVSAYLATLGPWREVGVWTHLQYRASLYQR